MPTTNLGDLLWLTGANAMKLMPVGSKIARLARTGAMMSFWARDDGLSPPVTLHDVIAMGASAPECQFTYIHSN